VRAVSYGFFVPSRVIRHSSFVTRRRASTASGVVDARRVDRS